MGTYTCRCTGMCVQVLGRVCRCVWECVRVCRNPCVCTCVPCAFVLPTLTPTCCAPASARLSLQDGRAPASVAPRLSECVLLRLLLGGRCHSLSVHPRCCPHRRPQWGHGAPAVSSLMYNPDHRQTSVASEFTHLPGDCQRNTRIFKESTDLIIRDTYYKGHYTGLAD